MGIVVYQLDQQHLHHFDQFDRLFTVTEKVVLQLRGGELTWSATPVEPYEKSIPVDDAEAVSFVDAKDKVVFLAKVAGQLAGQIKLLTWWNGYAYIADLIVKPDFRRHGVARALLDKSVQWARARSLPGIMLETQDNNVPACKLYESCGFVLGGFDQFTLKNLKSLETALFWYKFI